MSALRTVAKASLTHPGRGRGWTARRIAKQKSRRRSWYGRIAKRDYSAIHEVERMRFKAGFSVIWNLAWCLIAIIVGQIFDLRVMLLLALILGSAAVSAVWEWIMLKRRVRKLEREIPWTECAPPPGLTGHQGCRAPIELVLRRIPNRTKAAAYHRHEARESRRSRRKS